MQWVHIRSPMHVSARAHSLHWHTVWQSILNTWVLSYVYLRMYRRGPLHACKCKRVNVSHGKVHRVLKQATCRCTRNIFLRFSLVAFLSGSFAFSFLLSITMYCTQHECNGKCSFSVRKYTWAEWAMIHICSQNSFKFTFFTPIFVIFADFLILVTFLWRLYRICKLAYWWSYAKCSAHGIRIVPIRNSVLKDV